MSNEHDQSDVSDLSYKKDLLKELSSQDFLNFGVHDVAYIRAVVVEGVKAYAVHAADGTPLSVMESSDSAEIAARHNDLEPVSIH